MDMINKDNLWAIYYENDAYSITKDKVMGRQAAGNSLLKAYAESDLDKVGVYARNENSFNDFVTSFSALLPSESKKNLSYIPWGNPKLLSDFGGLYYPAPDFARFANYRYSSGHNSYSIVGVTHTTASQSAIDSILNCFIEPLMPWDALICTSKSVKNSVDTLYDEYYNILKNRLGITKKPNFETPIIPLGVHSNDYNFTDDQINSNRKSLGINENDIVLLFLGRLSFHAKAHYLPMYLAVNKVKESLPSDVNIHLIQTGWFPNDPVEKMFREDTAKIAPNVKFHFLDGRKPSNKRLSFSVSDIFISLVDNFQETFGLTPLEGMAAGLPVIVSDWDGYRDTVRDGIDGYRIPSATMEPGNGYNYYERYYLGLDTYDHYIGRTSQTVSINIVECIEKIKLLASDKDLRIKLGKNAKKRAQDYEWSNIIDSYKLLKSELDAKRDFSIKDNEKFLKPIRIQDPYAFFNDYASFKINENTIVSSCEDINNIDLDDFIEFESVSFLNNITPNRAILNDLLNYINRSGEVLLIDLIKEIKLEEFIAYQSVLWLSKYGYINIRDNN
jgi:glycosyltransferase involved in cell wall biosynthesis